VIQDKSRTPFIYQQEITDFISCTGINEGVIEVYGGEFNPLNVPPLGYRYEWTLANGSPMPTYAVYNADSSRVSNLENGTYQVLITNKSTGCQETANYTIQRREVTPVLLLSKLSDQTYCYGDGAAEVTEVRLAGNSLNLNNYRYTWYEEDLSTTISSPSLGLSTDSLNATSLVAGTYFVVAENLVTGCTTLPVQLQIEDNVEPLIVVLNDISEPITACDPTNFPDGNIEVDVRNSQNILSSWYRGFTITDPADSISGFNNLLEIDNLVPGAYTIWVMDTLSGCSTTRTYTIEGIEVPVVVTTSSMSFSSCIQPNGMVAANVNGGSGEYIFTWFISNENGMQQLNVANNKNYLEGLSNGTYTVVVQDRNEPYCEESRAEIVVEDSRGDEIMIMVNNDFQMTHCDDSNPNGQLSVEVNGELSRYNFFWYAGTNVNSKPIASGPVLGKLSAGNYTVIARDKVNGCISNAFTGTVIAVPDTTIIPAPLVSSFPVTRCDRANGSAIAVLDSTMIDPNVDYRYTWFNEDGEEVFSSSRTNEVNFLAAGNYSVVVSHAISGCASASTDFSIGEDIYMPEFELLSTPSICQEANGTIMIDFIEPIRVVDIEWVTPEGYANGFFLTNQPPGFYEVTITDDKGCQHTRSGVINANIQVFNGVSPNGDGKNDRFIISCIDQYSENVVRIYNRTGAIVYEDFRYDNELTYFEGYGNRGLYIGGEELPEGTYYYIIDKKNGEEPQSGFLELLR
jgi:gliding motility-associated-like protein